MFDRMNQWVSAQLATSSGATAFLFLFLGGVLASLLPCVYPLYPITANILHNRRGRLGRFAHPLAYYAGLGAIYFSFGFVASLTGGAFNQVLRLPLANLVIGIVLFALALSTVHYLEFPVIGADLGGKSAGLLGTFTMGAGAGLLSSACVGPVVVSVLVELAASSAPFSVGVTLLATFKMLLFGLGVGLPIMLIGAAGVTLPRSGRWMLIVQWAFGLLIAWFSLGYVLKGLAGFGFGEDMARTILLGAGLVLSSVFLIQNRELPAHTRMKNALLAFTGVVGALVLARALLPTGAQQTLAAAPASAPSLQEKMGGLTWFLDKETAYRTAATDGKRVFIDFHGDWCTNCKAFQERLTTDTTLRQALEKAVLLKVIDTSALFRSYRDDPRFPELKVGLPFFVITDADGNLIYKTSDYTRTDEMVLMLSG